jgi:uncharacterized membrane protein
MNEAEKKFLAENGMSLSEAWDTVLKWKQEGKFGEAKKGCEEILRFFPERQDARALLEVISQEQSEQKDPGDKKMGGMATTFKNVLKKMDVSQSSLPGIDVPNRGERLVGSLCYVHIFAVLPLFLKRDSDFIQFHAWQGITLSFLTWGFYPLVSFFLSLIGLYFLVSFIFFGILLFHCFGVYFAYSGKKVCFPLVFQVSQKIRELF